MKSKILVHPNPSRQERDNKVMEISFYNSEGDYRGMLMSLRFFEDKPVINLYRIDEDIKVNVAQEREKPY